MRDRTPEWVDALAPLGAPASAAPPATDSRPPLVWVEPLGGACPDRLTVDWTIRVHCLAQSPAAAQDLALRAAGIIHALPGARPGVMFVEATAPACDYDSAVRRADATAVYTITTLRG